VTVETSRTKAATDPPGAKPAVLAARRSLTALAVLAGGAVGFLGSFSHRDQAVWLGVSWPVGLIYAFAGLAGLLLALGELPAAPTRWLPGRLPASGSAGFGWLIALLWVTYFGPPPGFALKGDVVLADDWISMVYLIGGMGLVTVGVYRSWLAVLEVKLADRRR
jgi:hypothetical protein